jgi:hypothetical protein
MSKMGASSTAFFQSMRYTTVYAASPVCGCVDPPSLFPFPLQHEKHPLLPSPFPAPFPRSSSTEAPALDRQSRRQLSG